MTRRLDWELANKRRKANEEIGYSPVCGAPIKGERERDKARLKKKKHRLAFDEMRETRRKNRRKK